jgi:putative toxin-antitoxin system antitoxin component (TIGR02293 family)
MIPELQAVAEVLGVAPPANPMDMVRRIEEGLPTSSVDRVAKRVAPANLKFRDGIIPKATRARRRSHRLTPEQSAKVARLDKIWARAHEVWKDDERTREFLFRPHPMLDGRQPAEVALSTDMGADVVDQILGRLEFGSAA